MAMQVNQALMNVNPLNVKDSRWLTLEVCREYTRNKCVRTDTECKFAHPPPHVEVQNGRVTCCFDSIKVSPGKSAGRSVGTGAKIQYCSDNNDCEFRNLKSNHV